MTAVLHRILIVMSVVFAMSFFFLPSTGQAAESCQCICGLSSGAVVGKITTTDEKGSECKSDCGARGGLYLRCATKADQFPEESQFCWERSKCEARIVPINGVDQKSEWGTKQPYDCPASEHYCYNPPTPVSLSVAISTLTSTNKNEVQDLGTYIVALYDLLLPAAALLAVLMLMIGGVQYLVAGGNETRIGAAKERISKAIIGLIIIIFAYTIVYTIDPRLTSFEEFRVPAIEGKVFIDAGSRCGVLDDQFCEIDPANCGNFIKKVTPAPDGITAGQCGSKCEVILIPEKAEGTVDVEVGDQLFYDVCPGGAQGCIIGGSGDTATAECINCWDVNPAQENKIAPSNASCSEMDPQPDGEPSKSGTVSRCFYTADSDITVLAAALIGGNVTQAVSGGTCGLFSFSCSSIKSCTDYGTQTVISGPPPSEEHSVYGDFVAGFKGLTGQIATPAQLYQIGEGNITFKDICLQDPCRENRTNSGNPCVWAPDNSELMATGAIKSEADYCYK